MPACQQLLSGAVDVPYQTTLAGNKALLFANLLWYAAALGTPEGIIAGTAKMLLAALMRCSAKDLTAQKV